MARYFNFYDPLEKRYLFNSFLVIVALVEVLILVFTLIWQMDEGVFAQQVQVVPFPWKEYLVAAFAAPIALLFLFGLIVQGFEMICREAQSSAPGGGGGWGARIARARYLLALAALLAGLALLFWGSSIFSLLTGGIKTLGLGGAYLIIAVMALALLYLPLRLLLRYRLQKKAMEYQYLLALAQRHGVLVADPHLHPETAAAIGEKKIPPTPEVLAPQKPADSQEEPNSH